VVRSGERFYLALAYSNDAPSVYPNLGDAAEQEIAMSLDFWRAWSAKCRYSGPGSHAVLRSALALKLLTYAPSGAVIAAPTTSLPEVIGGVRNWDYRFAWLRDASFTVGALHRLGFEDEGFAFVEWLLHATALTHPALQILYCVYGNAKLPERTLPQLVGYCDSRPVREGNDAYAQFQLDVYGQVMRALRDYYHGGGPLDSDTRGLLVGIADLVAKRWSEPDNGIWELRSGRVQNVYGKVMAWVALDGAIQVAREAHIRADVDRWVQAKDAIRSTVLREGFNPRLASFVAILGGEQLDASLLRLPSVGFIAGDDWRMISTIAAVRRSLAVGDFVYRYRGVDDGLPGQEGPFLACSFWLVSSLALAGQLDESLALFTRLLSRANDLGLFSEEIDPETGGFLGNFPQALTHESLINAGLTLQRVDSGDI
jgi:GH15 family glucan-1,4-alpha-glucosidase